MKRKSISQTNLQRKIGETWRQRQYSLSAYWSRTIENHTDSTPNKARQLADDCLTRYQKGLRSQWECRDATFYWEHYGRAQQALSDYCANLGSMPWVDELKLEIQWRQLEQNATNQILSGEPRQPKPFTQTINGYPPQRPYYQQFQDAQQDFNRLKEFEGRFETCADFAALARMAEECAQASEDTIWTELSAHLFEKADERFLELHAHLKSRVVSLTSHAQFGDAKVKLAQFNEHSATFQAHCPGYQHIENLETMVDNRLKEWEEQSEAFERFLDRYDFDSCEAVLNELKNYFQAEAIARYESQLAQARERQDKLIAKLELFKTTKRWRDLSQTLEKNRKSLPPLIAKDYEEWAQRARNRTLFWKFCVGIIATAALLLVLIQVLGL